MEKRRSSREGDIRKRCYKWDNWENGGGLRQGRGIEQKGTEEGYIMIRMLEKTIGNLLERERN